MEGYVSSIQVLSLLVCVKNHNIYRSTLYVMFRIFILPCFHYDYFYSRPYTMSNYSILVKKVSLITVQHMSTSY